MKTFKEVIRTIIGVPFDIQETLNVLSSQTPIIWSWGIRDFVRYKDQALAFKVSGYLFKGNVVITLAANDTYTVHLINNRNRIIKKIEQIYFDQLVEVIDINVEKIPLYRF